jgi:hypothetical protein
VKTEVHRRPLGDEPALHPHQAVQRHLGPLLREEAASDVEPAVAETQVVLVGGGRLTGQHLQDIGSFKTRADVQYTILSQTGNRDIVIGIHSLLNHFIIYMFLEEL